MKFKLIFFILNIIVYITIVLSSGKYNGYEYLNGINAGYKSGWSNSDLGPLMGEAKIRSQRMKFPCTFFDTWGYNILYDNDSFGSAKRAGQSNFTAFITFNHSDDSRVPKSIYQPIWVDDEVNPDNEFALCVSKIVSTYKNDVKIYEIYNEPDWVSDWTVVDSWKTSPPTAAQLPRFEGDIYTYIRLLRIAWEVAKSIDPTCFITVGGLGYSPFLDAVLRYSDTAGVTDSSLLGINYIDAISTHCYPMYRAFKTSSDSYLDAYSSLQDEFRAVTTKYNFNPSVWIVTETGVPTSSGAGYYGSEALARNYFLKLPSISVKKGVCQNHIFILGDTDSGTNAFSKMGLFYDYQKVAKDKAVIKESSKGLITWDYHLYGKNLDQFETDRFKSKLPSGVIVYAYSSAEYGHCYLIWANSTDYFTEIETPSIQVNISAEIVAVFNYLNYKSIKTSSTSSQLISLTVDATPQFIYINTDGPEGFDIPSSSSILSYSVYLISILFIQLLFI